MDSQKHSKRQLKNVLSVRPKLPLVPKKRKLQQEDLAPTKRNRRQQQQPVQQQQLQPHLPLANQQQQQQIVPYNAQEMDLFRQRVLQRQLEFAATRIPPDAQRIPEMAFRTTASNYLWCGWEPGMVFPRFVGVLKKKETSKTKAGLDKVVLTFSIHSAETVIVYGWADQLDALGPMEEYGRRYTLQNLKVMPNTGQSRDGTRQDRGG